MKLLDTLAAVASVVGLVLLIAPAVILMVLILASIAEPYP